MPANPDSHEFLLGLTFAGAISAGAYNAGVFDFLIQALEEWEKARGGDDVPDHRVTIPVITGASAGGATAALGLVTLKDGIELPPANASGVRVLPKLHRIWAERLSFVDRSHGPPLLGTADLRKGGRLGSLLDGTAIDAAALDLVKTVGTKGPPRPYLAEKLHLFLTLTNLRGTPYCISFNTGNPDDAYPMSLHGDRAHFVFEGVGEAGFSSRWLADYGDSGLPISVERLKARRDPDTLDPEDTDIGTQFIAAALGTGAFPIGLPGRLILRKTLDYKGRAWPYPKGKSGDITPSWPRNRAGTTDYPVSFGAADGGVIDNEPFELARWTIMADPATRRNPSGAREADRAVLLVDPFPQAPTFATDLTPEETLAQTALVSVIKALIPALKNQARVKAVDLAASADKTIYSRFLILPSRTIGEKPEERDAPDALATGVFFAFGGFLAHAFPQHDYQLGRRNCQRFLQKHLVLSEDNPVVKAWPAAAVARFTGEGTQVEAGFRPLIPLVGSAAQTVEQHPWPRIGEDVIDAFVAAVEARLAALVKKALAEEMPGLVWSFAGRIVWMGYRGRILAIIRDMLIADLIRRDQHADWTGLDNELDRDILALLHDPFHEGHTPARMALRINMQHARDKGFGGISEVEVRARLAAAPLRDLVATVPGTADAVQLRSRASRWRALPVIGLLHRRFKPPRID